MARTRNLIILTLALYLPALLMASNQIYPEVQIEEEIFPALKETGRRLMQAVGEKDFESVKVVLQQLTPVEQIALLSPIYKVAIPDFATVTTPLLYAAYVGSDEIFKMFLEATQAYPEFTHLFISKTKSGTSAYHLALRAGHRQIEDIILSFVAKHDGTTSLMSSSDNVASVLHIAADRGDLAGVKKLLDFAVAHPRFEDLVVGKNNQKRNALHFAVSRNHVAVVKALLGSPFRARFFEDEELIPFTSLKEYDRAAMRNLIWSYSTGEYEAAFFARDLEKCREFASEDYPFEMDLFNAMIANSTNVDEQAYLDFICELNPLFYLIIWPYQKLLYLFSR